MSARLAQTNKEALLTLALYGAFFLWWCVFAFAPGADDPATYSYVFGFPAWFFYSCVLGYPLITLLLWVTLRLGFKDMDLGEPDGPDSPAKLAPENASQIPLEPAAAGHTGESGKAEALRTSDAARGERS